jgi:hypothetical protein
MKQNTWTIFIVALLLILDAFLLYKTVHHKRLIAAYQSILEDNTSKANSMEWLKLNFESGLKNNGLTLDNIIIKDSLNKEIRLQDLFKNGRSQILVSRFTSLCCESCAIYSAQKICSLADSINKTNIVFLASYDSNNNFALSKNRFGIQGKEVYNTMNFLNIPVEEQSFPYYFVVDSNLKISDVFLPDKMAPDLTNRYLDAVMEKYFRQDPEYSEASTNK